MAKIFKRIFKDIQEFKKSDLHTHGIYCEFDEKNLYKVYALIIGPKDTPYEDGFYFFKIEFPQNYPLSPPSVIYMTQGHHIRFNPNLYTNGKVCVSILNTWSGPEWTTSCTLISVLLSIQTLLNENPIHNEPGWDTIKKTDIRCVNYNNTIAYANLKIAILDMIEHPPYHFEIFKDIMLNHLHHIHFKLEDKIKNNLNEDHKILKTEIYSLTIRTDYQDCLYRLKEYLKIPINKSNIEMFYHSTKLESNVEPKEDPNVKPIETTPKSIRKVPKENANLFDIGYEKLSENDGKYYMIGLTKTNKKRWTLK